VSNAATPGDVRADPIPAAGVGARRSRARSDLFSAAMSLVGRVSAAVLLEADHRVRPDGAP
jgi:hypothetical protein